MIKDTIYVVVAVAVSPVYALGWLLGRIYNAFTNGFRA